MSDLNLTDDNLTFNVTTADGPVTVDTLDTLHKLLDCGTLDTDCNWRGTEVEIRENFRKCAGLPESLSAGNVTRVRNHWMGELAEAQKKMAGEPNSPPSTGSTPCEQTPLQRPSSSAA